MNVLKSYNVEKYYIVRSRGVAVNMPACHAGDRRFDPGRDRHLILNSEPILGINSGVGFFVSKIL